MDKWTGIKADRAVVLQTIWPELGTLKKNQTAGQAEAAHEQKKTTTKSKAICEKLGVDEKEVV